MPGALVGGFVDLTRVDAFDFIQLDYRVDWPLTLVLTSAAMAQYQAVFRFLLRAKHATFSLRDVWRDLQVRGSVLQFATCFRVFLPVDLMRLSSCLFFMPSAAVH